MFQKKRRTFSLSDFERISADSAEADNSRELDAYRRFLSAAIKALPAGQREAVVLYYQEGLTIEQAARQLQVSVSTVWRRLNAAKQFLQLTAKLCMDAGLLR